MTIPYTDFAEAYYHPTGCNKNPWKMAHSLALDMAKVIGMPVMPKTIRVEEVFPNYHANEWIDKTLGFHQIGNSTN